MKEYIFHFRTDDEKRKNRGGITVGIIEETLNQMESNNIKRVFMYKVGVCVCSSKDQFCKKNGRVKALGRAESNKFKARYIALPIRATMEEIRNIAIDVAHKAKKSHSQITLTNL
jgi:hypothetical protein